MTPDRWIVETKMGRNRPVNMATECISRAEARAAAWVGLAALWAAALTPVLLILWD